MSGQIMDATPVAAPRQRNTEDEKARIKAGETAKEIWKDEPFKARQKDTDARWTVKFSKAGPAEDGQKQQIDIAIPTFGYKNHISVDRRHGVIRKSLVTDAAAHGGARLREGLIDPSNTASDVWTDSAYRSAENERFLKGVSKTSRIHRRKPKGRPCRPERARRMLQSRRSAAILSTSSPTRRGPWEWSCAPSALPGQRPRSRWRTWPTT